MQYTVVKSELNKFKFGNVVLEGGGTLHPKGKWGFSTGKKNQMPPCQAGDIIEAEIYDNNGYANIKNIKVVGKGEVKQPKKSGVEFRTPDQLMRTTSVEQAIANNSGEGPMTVEDIIMFSDELFDYIKNGSSPVATNQMPEDEPPFPE